MSSNYILDSRKNYIGKTQYLNTGFTLVEAVITVTILAILSAVAIPSFVSSLRKWEANEMHSLIVNSIKTAKSQSLIYRQHTIMCMIDVDDICHKNGSHYLFIFSDSNGNNRFDADIDTVIAKQPLNLDYGRLYLRAANRHYVKFFADTGLPRGHFGHIKYCPNNGDTNNMYQVSLNQHGNYRFKPYDFKDTGCP